MIEELKALLRSDEGTGPIKNGRLMPYEDSKGNLTIGYGRAIGLVGIRESEANFMLDNDIVETIKEIQGEFDWFSRLNEARQAVVVSMVFNMGMPKFAGWGKEPGFLKTIAYLNAGDYVSAAAEMLDSRAARSLPTRYKRLSHMMETGTWL